MSTCECIGNESCNWCYEPSATTVSKERTEAITAWYRAWQQGTFAVYFTGDLSALIARKCGCEIEEVDAVIQPIQKAARNRTERAHRARTDRLAAKIAR